MINLKRKALVTIVALSGVLALAGCETTNGNNNALKKGAVGALAGAAAGAIIGNNAGDGDGQSGALIGAVIGGAGGAYAGCREDGGCGARPQNRNYNHDYSRQQNAPVVQGHTQGQTINKRQFFDQNTGRYYFYDPATRMEYYENGERKYR
ncbi:MAG: glycine zipper 2TM domain-containing protein [Robiginitomaculum sp.]|nr:glycine zipper 2TM domain-containing protein [Robiginitomaculum sp.]